ncbi:MAG: methyltransferase domain-containing protein [Gemmatimonadetes bacterium]|nr:MAG: methyltransferase domain-containing protein [Gemmatimonadota bacterium]
MRQPLEVKELKDIYASIALRYDFQHGLITVGADQRGRKLLVDKLVSAGDKVLDCGSGTGATGLLAAKKVGPDGKVTLFDLSDAMLTVARQKVIEAGLEDKVHFITGDIVHLPFANDEFDVVLSTYSMCSLYDPRKGALELYRVTKPGGKIGVAHSTEPKNPIAKWLAARVEDWAWRFPRLSMGCRSVEVLSVLKIAGGKVLFSKKIGVPLWPFLVFIVEKPVP